MTSLCVNIYQLLTIAEWCNLSYFLDKPARLSVVVAVTDSYFVKVAKVTSNVHLELVGLTLSEGFSLWVVTARGFQFDLARLRLVSVRNKKHFVVGCHGGVASGRDNNADVTICKYSIQS